MGRPAARILDPVLHLLPGRLMPGPGSFNVHIGSLFAWRGLPLGSAGGLQAAKAASDTRVNIAKAATLAAAGTPGLPAVKAAEEVVKATEAATMGAMIMSMAGGADIHMCIHIAPIPLPPPHGPGVVIDGSKTVHINGLPACRMMDTIMEAFGPTDKIMLGMLTVHIGDGTGGGQPGSDTVDPFTITDTPNPDGTSSLTAAGNQRPPGPQTVSSAQAATLKAAHKGAVPFCEVCGR